MCKVSVKSWKSLVNGSFLLTESFVKIFCLLWQVCDAPLWTLPQWCTPRILWCTLGLRVHCAHWLNSAGLCYSQLFMSARIVIRKDTRRIPQKMLNGVIGVGEGKCLVVRRNLTRIFPNLPENVWATFRANIFTSGLFRDDLPKKDPHVILQTLGAIFQFKPCWVPFFSNQTTLGAIFFPRFSGNLGRFFKYFAQHARKFARIFTKSKL